MILIEECALKEVKCIKLHPFTDNRGFFEEIYSKDNFKKWGIETTFVQDNHSYSKKGVIRGMHFQSTPGQAKLVSVLAGSIYDVYVDIRPHSPHFGKWGAKTLHAEEHEQLYIPVGFAHGFAVLTGEAHVLYKVSEVYNPLTEKTFRFDDPQVGIEWPIEKPILSDKDRRAPSFREIL